MEMCLTTRRESWERALRLKWLTWLYLKLNTPGLPPQMLHTTACDQSQEWHRKATFLWDKRAQSPKRMSPNNENVTLARGTKAEQRHPVCWLEAEHKDGQWSGGKRRAYIYIAHRFTTHPLLSARIGKGINMHEFASDCRGLWWYGWGFSISGANILKISLSMCVNWVSFHWQKTIRTVCIFY